MGRRKYDRDYVAYMLRRSDRSVQALDRAIAIVRRLQQQLVGDPEVLEIFLNVEKMLEQQLAFAVRARERWLQLLGGEREAA